MKKTLLHLPPELRQIVYSFIFNDSLLITLSYAAAEQPKRPSGTSTKRPVTSTKLAVFLTCRQLYAECKSIALKDAVFQVKDIPEIFWKENDSGAVEDAHTLRNRFHTLIRLNITSIKHVCVCFSLFKDFWRSVESYQKTTGHQIFPNTTHYYTVWNSDPSALPRNHFWKIFEPFRLFPQLRYLIMLWIPETLSWDNTPNFEGSETDFLDSRRQALNWRFGFELLGQVTAASQADGTFVLQEDCKCFNENIKSDHFRFIDPKTKFGCLGIKRPLIGNGEDDQVRDNLREEIQHIRIFMGSPREAVECLNIPWEEQCPSH